MHRTSVLSHFPTMPLNSQLAQLISGEGSACWVPLEAGKPTVTSRNRSDNCFSGNLGPCSWRWVQAFLPRLCLEVTRQVTEGAGDTWPVHLPLLGSQLPTFQTQTSFPKAERDRSSEGHNLDHFDLVLLPLLRTPSLPSSGHLWEDQPAALEGGFCRASHH